MTIRDTLNAFVDHGHVERKGAAEGPLAGLTFGLKDLFHLAGVPTAAGSPDWLATHPVPTQDAPIVTLLLDAGATLVGKTHTDELAWSLNGENAHYGTPINAAAPGRIPGGSSSGSAAAVGGGLVDFAIGSDTGGSVRLPASYNGVYGLRPTHGRVDISGAVALAESFDVVGWFSQDPQVFARVGAVLLGAKTPKFRPQRLLVADDMFAKAGPEVSAAHEAALSALKTLFPTVETVTIGGESLPEWRNAFRILQGAEAWAYHKDWVRSAKPKLGPGVKERMEAASQFTEVEIAAARKLRDHVRSRIEALLDEDTVIVLPTTPGIALPRGMADKDLEAFRAKALELLCTAGLAGLPQLSMPLSMLDGCPLGLSIMAARGMDEQLMEIACDPVLKRRTA
ncbi:MAG: amidase [Beijerinckiaceae bacterium]|nr:amidase [Beijerinckiaceae bacterium]